MAGDHDGQADLCSFVSDVSIETSRGSTWPEAKSARASAGRSRFGFSSRAASSPPAAAPGPAASAAAAAACWSSCAGAGAACFGSGAAPRAPARRPVPGRPPRDGARPAGRPQASQPGSPWGCAPRGRAARGRRAPARAAPMPGVLGVGVSVLVTVGVLAWPGCSACSWPGSAASACSWPGFGCSACSWPRLLAGAIPMVVVVLAVPCAPWCDTSPASAGAVVVLDRLHLRPADRLDAVPAERLVDDPGHLLVRAAAEADELERADALGGCRHEHARETGHGLAQLERVEGLGAPASAAQLLGQFVEAELLAGCRRVAPELGAERGVGQQPLDQVGGLPGLLRRRHPRSRDAP